MEVGVLGSRTLPLLNFCLHWKEENVTSCGDTVCVGMDLICLFLFISPISIAAFLRGPVGPGIDSISRGCLLGGLWLCVLGFRLCLGLGT